MKDAYENVAIAITSNAECAYRLSEAIQLVSRDCAADRALRDCLHKTADLQLQLTLLLKQYNKENK